MRRPREFAAAFQTADRQAHRVPAGMFLDVNTALPCSSPAGRRLQATALAPRAPDDSAKCAALRPMVSASIRISALPLPDRSAATAGAASGPAGRPRPSCTCRRDQQKTPSTTALKATPTCSPGCPTAGPHKLARPAVAAAGAGAGHVLFVDLDGFRSQRPARAAVGDRVLRARRSVCAGARPTDRSANRRRRVRWRSSVLPHESGDEIARRWPGGFGAGRVRGGHRHVRPHRPALHRRPRLPAPGARRADANITSEQAPVTPRCTCRARCSPARDPSSNLFVPVRPRT